MLPPQIKFHLADYLTFTGFICSLLAIVAAFQYHFLTAYLFIAAQIIFDYFDGRVARSSGTASELGKSLDNFSDYTTIIATALLGYFMGLSWAFAVACLLLFVLAAMVRLSFFTVLGTQDGYFRGVPTTFCSAFASTLLIVNHYFIHSDIAWLALVFLLLTVLMPSPIKIKKL